MTHRLMSDQEMRDFGAHIVQLTMHAGHSLNDVLRAAPAEHTPAIKQMIEATRAYYRAAAHFEQALADLGNAADRETI